MNDLYILKSLVNNKYYIGSTKDLDKRLQEHNNGKNKYTKFYMPYELIFKQSYNSIQEARKIEYKLKKLKSRKIIEKIIKDGFIKLGS